MVIYDLSHIISCICYDMFCRFMYLLACLFYDSYVFIGAVFIEPACL